MENCPSCSKPLPVIGFFCGACLTQFKCKSCKTPLELDYLGCVNCGTPREAPKANALSGNINTFRLSETATDRTIEATFSDNVGKDLAGILRDSYAIKQMNKLGNQLIGNNGTSHNAEESFNEQPQIVEDADVIQQTNRPGHNNSSQAIAEKYPTLKAIAMKNLPASEVEWILVYAFYASSYGKESFTRQSLIEKYEESNRSTPERKNGLSANIRTAVRSGDINPLTSEYALLDTGIAKAKEIISRTTGSSPKLGKGRSKIEKNVGTKTASGNGERSKKKSTSSAPKRLSNLDLAPTGKISLADFYKQWTAKNNNDNNLLFIHYLQEILNISPISQDHVYTCYDALDLIIPTNFAAGINNTIARKGWIQTSNGNLSVTTKGSNHLKTWKNTKK